MSTAYSNADKRKVEEAVYPPPADPQQIIQLCQTLPEQTIEDLKKSMLGSKHPNTYTLTKAMAEWIVAEQSDHLPTAVVRPSIGMLHVAQFLS